MFLLTKCILFQVSQQQTVESCELAQIDHKTQNLSIRSFRPMVLQRLAERNVHSEVMRQRTGHSSLGAISAYTRYNREVSSQQVSEILNDGLVELPLLFGFNKNIVFMFAMIATSVFLSMIMYLFL